MKRRSIQLLAGAAFVAAAGVTAIGSSHREAPGIAGRPKLDGTDFSRSGATSRHAKGL